ncbi:NAD(P)-binding protein [Coniochaeta ligniaria NRRL 30616]|uniref:NAD(P)-binding protein n=1 Tax=Coniochaeta ligniaria NRRL 30616 TaxID=1408157 RepID=A0A1J7INX8_9PEZI|nr:NAD(P)-binding protein [Coniochaeta ligniaria NRRL 30616]
MVQSLSEFYSSQRASLPLVPTPSQIHGGTYIVTGGNHGLGLQAAKHLVRLTASRVVISSRSPANGAAALAEIERDTGVRGVAEAWQLDLGDFSSVKAFAEKVKGLERIDGLIENASIALDSWTESEGMETTVAVNVVGTFLLGLLVFPKLVESGKRFGIVPHLSIVGSGAGFYAEGVLEGIEGDILKACNTEGAVPMSGRYDQTKLLQLYIFRELAALLPYSKTGVVINYLSPGLCNTGLARHTSLKTRLFIRAFNMLLGRTPEMGSRTLLHVVVAGPESHGKYCADCAVKEYYIPEWVYSDSGKNIQKRLWKEVSEMLNNIEPGCVDGALWKAR